MNSMIVFANLLFAYDNIRSFKIGCWILWARYTNQFFQFLILGGPISVILGMIQFVVFLDSASDKMFMKLQILMKVISTFFDKYSKKISEKSHDNFFHIFRSDWSQKSREWLV